MVGWYVGVVWTVLVWTVTVGVGGWYAEVVGARLQCQPVMSQVQPFWQLGGAELVGGWLGTQQLLPVCQYHDEGQSVPLGGLGGLGTPPWGRQQVFAP